jgi:hypothetical protein
VWLYPSFGVPVFRPISRRALNELRFGTGGIKIEFGSVGPLLPHISRPSDWPAKLL